MKTEKMQEDKLKKALFSIILFSFWCSVQAQTTSCGLENCINSTFNSRHINKWSVINKDENLIEGDTFILTEARSGDTAYTDLDGTISIIFTRSFSLIAEHYDKDIFILPYKAKGESIKLKNQLPDSFNAFFYEPGDYEMDSLSSSIYRASEEDQVFTIKINRSTCLIEWIEIVKNEVEETEDENGFVIEVLVKKATRYVLLSNTTNLDKISKLITPSRYISKKNNINTVQPDYKSYELIDLTSDVE